MILLGNLQSHISVESLPVKKASSILYKMAKMQKFIKNLLT